MTAPDRHGPPDWRAPPALRLLAQSWMVAIMRELSNGPVRPTELERRLPGIPHSIAMARLAQLRDCGAATRLRTHGTFPVHAHYTLSHTGQELLTIATEAERWDGRRAPE